MASLSDLYTHLKTLCEQWFYNKSTIDGYLNNKISKSSTVGLVKNDGSIDTTSYSTFNGNYNSLSNKPSIPSKTSDLSNDSGFITSSSLPTKTSDLINDGEDGTNAFIDESDSRLTNARTPTSHTHGNLTNDGKVGSSSNYFVYTTTSGAITSKQKIGNITTSGAIGSTSGKPIITTTSGVLTTGSFGTSSGTFAEGNHTHSNYISTSSTTGLVKNDGTIDTTSYSTFDGDYDSLTNKPNIPSASSDLSDGSSLVKKSSTSGLIKNDGTIDTTVYSTFSGDYDDLTDKPTIPSKISDLTNDSDFIETSSTTGLVKNDGTIDTTQYLSSLPSHNHDVSQIIDHNGHMFIGSSEDASQGTINTLIDEGFSDVFGILSHKISTSSTVGLIKNDGSIDTTTYVNTNDSRLSDARTPTAHNQASSTITDSNTYANIGNTSQTQESINSAINSKLGELVDINFVTVVQTLPTASASTMGKIYLVPITGSGTNNYAEYVTVKSGSTYSWEKFGEVSGSGLSVDWSDITSKPSTYPPSSHTHNNISNDGKVTATGTNGGNLVVTNSSNQVIVESSIDVLDGVVQQLITYGSS